MRNVSYYLFSYHESSWIELTMGNTSNNEVHNKDKHIRYLSQ